jgi:hypothetical protein
MKNAFTMISQIKGKRDEFTKILDCGCIDDCPKCRDSKLEFIPISETEGYRLNLDRNGLSMEFWNLLK